MNYRLTKEERETIILFDESSSSCSIYTCSRPIMTKLDKFCLKHPDTYQLKCADEASKTYITDKTLISFRSGVEKRELTEAQKKARAESLKKARNAKALG